MEHASTGLDGKLDLEATSAGRHTLLSEPANGRRGYPGTKVRPLASGADAVRLTSFFSGSGGGWMVGLLKEGGRGEPGAEAAGLLAKGEEQDSRAASLEPGEEEGW